MKLSIIEAALVAAVLAIEEKVAAAADNGDEWRYKEVVPLFDDSGMFIADEITDDETCLRFSRSTLPGFDYNIYVAFCDPDGEVDHFILDIGAAARSLNIQLNLGDPEAIFHPINDLGTVINALARLDEADNALLEEARIQREAEAIYAARRSRFTVIENA